MVSVWALPLSTVRPFGPVVTTATISFAPKSVPVTLTALPPSVADTAGGVVAVAMSRNA